MTGAFKMASPVFVAVMLLCLLCTSATPASALKYAFKDTQPVCFVEEVEEGVNAIMGSYLRYQSREHLHIDMQLQLQDALGTALGTYDILPGPHRLHARIEGTPADGPITLCMHVTTRSFVVAEPEEPIFVEIAFDQTHSPLGHDEALDALSKRQTVDGLSVFTYTDFGGQKKDILQSREYLQQIERDLHNTMASLRDVRKRMKNGLYREERMRDTSESTFTRVWAGSLVVMAAAAATMWLQYGMLKNTIKRKKLV